MTKQKQIHKEKGVTVINHIHSERVSKKRIVKRSFLTGLLLSIFLGWLGIDRFYVNHIGLGILKLITVGGLGIWWLIDVIMFATKNVSYTEFE